MLKRRKISNYLTRLIYFTVRCCLYIYISYLNKTNHPISSNNHLLQTANNEIHFLKWNEGVVVRNQREHNVMLKKYEVVNRTAVSKKNSKSEVLITLKQLPFVTTWSSIKFIWWSVTIYMYMLSIAPHVWQELNSLQSIRFVCYYHQFAFVCIRRSVEN